MHRFLKLILYVVYLIATTGVFLYLQFPSETVIRYLSSCAEASYPGIQVSMNSMHPTFPPGVFIASGAVSFQDMPMVQTDSIRIRPMILSFFKPGMQVQFLGSAHQGRFRGVVEFEKKSRPLRYRVDAGFSGIEMKEMPILERLTGQRLSGKCDGRIAYNTDGKPGAVTAQMNALNCSFELASPLVKIKAVSFQQVHANLAFEKGRVGIKEVLFKGRQADGRLSGSITLKNPVQKSVIKLSGEMKPHPGFLAELGGRTPTQLLSNRRQGEANIAFKIGGTLEAPSFSF
jgi:type II secretion system protein N